MNISISKPETNEQTFKETIRKIISLSNAAIPALNTLVIAAIVFHEFGAYAWGSFVSEFLWLSIAAKVVNYGSKEFILQSAGDERESTGERINEAINAGVIFIPAFALLFLLLPFGISHVIWLTLWLVAKYIYQSYEAFFTIYNKQGVQIAGEITSTLFIISALLSNISEFSIVYLLQLFTTAEIIKVLFATLGFRNKVTLHFAPVINFTYIKNNFFAFSISFSILLKSRIDQLIATFCLPTETVAKYQVLMTIVLLSQSILYSLSYSQINRLYTLSYDYIRETSNKVIIRGIIAIILLALIIQGISYYTFSFEIASSIVISTFFILLSHLYGLSYIYALYRAKEPIAVIQINIASIVLTGIALPFIMHQYSTEGAFIFIAVISALQTIALKLRVRKLL
jgi:hypothetical protein